MGELLANLAILAAIVIGIAVFVAYPKFSLFSFATLALAYGGTQAAGFLGTVGGLIAGALLGGLLALAAYAIEEEIVVDREASGLSGVVPAAISLAVLVGALAFTAFVIYQVNR